MTPVLGKEMIMMTEDVQEKKVYHRRKGMIMMTEDVQEEKVYHRRKGMIPLILDVMSDRRWHTVQGVAKTIGYLETGTSAGIRSLRKQS